MNNPTKAQMWQEDFQRFMETEEVTPPTKISTQVLNHITLELNPNIWLVFTKISLIHLLMGSLTLLFCPQFGVAFFAGPGLGLMTLLMRFGETACMLGCGAFFLGGSTLVGSLILKPEEIKVIRKTQLGIYLLLSLASTAVFICLGAKVVFTLGLVWTVGSVLGGALTLELGWFTRIWLKNKKTQSW